MAIDYGTDIAALDDLPDPEVLVSGERNAAYAQGRRLLTPTGALEAIGDAAPYDSIDLREQLGARMSEQDLLDLQAQVHQVLSQDERVIRVEAQLTDTGRALQVEARHEGTAGPFDLVISIDSVTTTLLKAS